MRHLAQGSGSSACRRRASTSCPCRCFFFNDTATTDIYTLSLHDALPIYRRCRPTNSTVVGDSRLRRPDGRSEEHTSELQSREKLVCRLLLEKKKNKIKEPQPRPERDRTNRQKQQPTQY